MNKYRVYNETTGQHEYGIFDTEPTVCPDNPSDTMRVGSPTIVESNIEVGDGSAVITSLQNYKKLRFKEIDARTVELIAVGFQFDNGNGVKTFSMSNNAQINLLGVDMKRNDGILPITFHTTDDMDGETFTTPESVDAFFMTGLGTKKAHLDSGSALKVSIRTATDEAGVDAVVDNR
jgi:hypothetical protein